MGNYRGRNLEVERERLRGREIEVEVEVEVEIWRRIGDRIAGRLYERIEVKKRGVLIAGAHLTIW